MLGKALQKTDLEQNINHPLYTSIYTQKQLRNQTPKVKNMTRIKKMKIV